MQLLAQSEDCEELTKVGQAHGALQVSHRGEPPAVHKRQENVMLLVQLVTVSGLAISLDSSLFRCKSHSEPKLESSAMQPDGDAAAA